MSHHRTCCCGVCNPDQFGCDQLTGSASWSFDYRYNYARTLSGTWYDCYELSSQSANCSDPDAEGPYLWADQQGEWSGYFEMKVATPITNILNMPQSITVSDPPTNDELCELATWTTTASPGTCSETIPTVTVTSTLEYEGRQQSGWNPTLSSWTAENAKYVATVEVGWVSQPDLTFEAILRQRTPAYYDCDNIDPLNAICDQKTCYLDALFTIDTENKLRFRVSMTSYQYAGTDTGQTGTPTASYSYTSTWQNVLVPFKERRLYEGMKNCDDPSPPDVVHPMRAEDEDEAVSGWTNDVRRAIHLALTEAWNDVTISGQPPGLFMQYGYEPTSLLANVTDLMFRSDTTGWWPNSSDDQNMGNMDADTGDFEPITGCGMFLYYTGLDPTATHERSSEADISYSFTDCYACGPQESGSGTQTFDYGFVSTVNLLSLAALDCT